MEAAFDNLATMDISTASTEDQTNLLMAASVSKDDSEIDSMTPEEKAAYDDA